MDKQYSVIRRRRNSDLATSYGGSRDAVGYGDWIHMGSYATRAEAERAARVARNGSPTAQVKVTGPKVAS